MSDLADFCSDPQWAELLERLKSSSDILDLFSFRETQHSDLLAWCFNSREGHGQGDAILKDFLTAVYHASTSEQPGDLIKGKGLTKDFVKKWNPARVMTSSFAGACFFREYCLPAESKETSKCYLDLLIIDTDNKFVVAIENKAGAKLTTEQLQRYVGRLQRSILSRPAFAGFDVAFVALDRNFDPDVEPEACSFDKRWALLGYEWLSGAAKRAEISASRGNRDSALVLSYCRQQINYESDEQALINRLSREIAIKHKGIVEALSTTRDELGDPTSWTPTHLEVGKPAGQMLRLLMQNYDACDFIFDLPQVELLHGRVVEDAPYLMSDDFYDKARVYVSYAPYPKIPAVDDYWPLYVTARHINQSKKGDPCFRVSLTWRPHYVAEEYRAEFTGRVRKAFPEARKVSTKSAQLGRSEVSSIPAAQKEIVRFLELCKAIVGPSAGSHGH